MPSASDAAEMTQQLQAMPWARIVVWQWLVMSAMAAGFTAWVMRLQKKLSESELSRVTDVRDMHAQFYERQEKMQAERREETTEMAGAMAMMHRLADKLAKDLEKTKEAAAQIQAEKLALAQEKLALAEERIRRKTPPAARVVGTGKAE